MTFGIDILAFGEPSKMFAGRLLGCLLVPQSTYIAIMRKPGFFLGGGRMGARN
jgi:hypothetical protein